MALSRDPAEVELEDLNPDALARLSLTNGYRYIVVHERGYYLVDPMRGSILYDRAVTMRDSSNHDVRQRGAIETFFHESPHSTAIL